MATIFAFNDDIANNQASNSYPLGAPSLPGSQCSTILGIVTPPGAAPYLVGTYRYTISPGPTLNGQNVIDLVMPGGPNNPQTW